MKNINTKRKTESNIRIFKDWLSTVGERRNPEYIGVEEMYMHLARVFFSARPKFKQDYEPDLLQASISRYLSDGECDIYAIASTIENYENKTVTLIFISNNSVQSTVTSNNSNKQTVIVLASILPNSKITEFPYSNIQGNVTIIFYDKNINDKNWKSDL